MTMSNQKPRRRERRRIQDTMPPPPVPLPWDDEEDATEEDTLDPDDPDELNFSFDLEG